MTNESTEAVWIESDGVCCLPTTVGCYLLRDAGKNPSARGLNYSWFDGERFCMVDGSPVSSARWTDSPSLWFEKGYVNAWRDYQGLMATPQAKIDHVHTAGISGNTTSGNTTTGGDNQGIHFGASIAIMPSDEPGIQSAKYAAKYEAKQEAPTIINGVQVDPVALAAFLASQRPAPEVNNSPRGLLFFGSDNFDHRLGSWKAPE